MYTSEEMMNALSDTIMRCPPDVDYDPDRSTLTCIRNALPEFDRGNDGFQIVAIWSHWRKVAGALAAKTFRETESTQMTLLSRDMDLVQCRYPVSISGRMVYRSPLVMTWEEITNEAEKLSAQGERLQAHSDQLFRLRDLRVANGELREPEQAA